MRMAEALVPEFDQEMAGVRKHLERLPEDKFDWQPHAKSMKAGKLASHMADIPSWTAITFEQDTMDIHGYETPQFTTRDTLLTAFDANVAKSRAALATVSDEVASGAWSMTGGGQLYFTMPKMGVIRTWVLNHIIHHRAQMGVYLRLLDVPVPGVYGPTADEM